MIAFLRNLGRAEAWSLILLLAVAMPLRSLADLHLAVTIAGTAHGVLWLAYVLLVAWAWYRGRLSVGFAILLVFLSVVPAGPFLVERYLGDHPAPPATPLGAT